MRKQLRSALIASAALIMLAIPPSWAAPGGNPGGDGDGDFDDGIPPSWAAPEGNPGANCAAPGQANKPPCNQVNHAPEINVGAGGAGLTVIAIALLLAAERRSRSS